MIVREAVSMANSRCVHGIEIICLVLLLEKLQNFFFLVSFNSNSYLKYFLPKFCCLTFHMSSHDPKYAGILERYHVLLFDLLILVEEMGCLQSKCSSLPPICIVEFINLSNKIGLV